ncbi:hypothetical protein [Estrella lausannensis]|uniref:Putative membrane protein n=1 Tax=Estrella lausannensis TaxID=483423 RepID=A0A0H5DS06_9BACT|nr:hypothetical protein [Estrella lausannensis]CRX39437.1 putative membrane protein [Estrella lausannensis]
MKVKPLLVMIAVAVTLSGVLLVQRLINYMQTEEVHFEKRINPNWIRGSSATIGEKPYTLNLDQQMELISIVNESELFSQTGSLTAVSWPKLLLYRFSGQPDVTVTVVGVNEGKAIFKAEPVGKDQLLAEKSAGSMKKLIDSSRDTL